MCVYFGCVYEWIRSFNTILTTLLRVREEGLWKMPSLWQTLQGLWLQWTVKPVVHTIKKWMSAKLCKCKSGFWSKATYYVAMNWFHAWFTCYLSHRSWAFSVRFLEKRKWCQDFFRVAKILQQLLMFLFHILPHAFLSTVEHKRININNVLVIFFYIIIFYTLFSCIWKYIHI